MEIGDDDVSDETLAAIPLDGLLTDVDHSEDSDDDYISDSTLAAIPLSNTSQPTDNRE